MSAQAPNSFAPGPLAPGAFLSRAALEELEQRQSSKGEPLLADMIEDESRFDNWGYRLRLGSSYRSASSTYSRADDDVITIESGEFALLLTREVVSLPMDHAGFISIKLRHKLRGLVNVSGFHVDPGYRGRLLFSVYNAGPRKVSLQHGEVMFMLLLARLDREAAKRPQTSIMSIRPEDMDRLQGPAVSVQGLAEQVSRLDHRMTVLQVLLGTLIASVLVALLKDLLSF